MFSLLKLLYHFLLSASWALKFQDLWYLWVLFLLFQFLVLDEADRVLDVGFEEELRVIFKFLPKSRQTLLFSATMTSNLQALLQISGNRSYFYEGYEGFKTVDSLEQQFVITPKNLKDVYLFHILSRMEERNIRSVMVFVSTCRYVCSWTFWSD